VEDDGELARDRHTGFLEADLFGESEPPGLQRRKGGRPGEKTCRRFVEVFTGDLVALLGDAAIAADLSGFVSSRGETEIGSGA
jgi:hypothetical protein